ncbi:MAG: hypothetical protein AB1805_06130 [Nitrospirota bacterium]
MCVACERRCRCGSRSASFHFKDNVLSDRVVRELYCPSCSPGITVDPASMVADNGWVIELDMEVAAFMGRCLPFPALTPDILFDEGYCSWNGMYPGDHIDCIREREAIVPLAKSDPARYLKEMRLWATQRNDRLSAEGWRKARKPTAV